VPGSRRCSTKRRKPAPCCEGGLRVSIQICVIVAVGRNQERHTILDPFAIQPRGDHIRGQAPQHWSGRPQSSTVDG
jgi:hypothetical protein